MICIVNLEVENGWNRPRLPALTVRSAILILSWILSCGCGAQLQSTPAVADSDIFVSILELKERMGNLRLVVLDASSRPVYEAGHIPGAVHIGFHGLSKVTGAKGDPGWGTIMDPAELSAKLGELGIDDDSFVVVYSDIFKGPGSCGRTLWQLRVAGFENSRMLRGGLQAWKTAGHALSVETVTPVARRGPKLAAYDDTMRAFKQDVFRNLGSEIIVDVRSKGEFSGEDHSRGEARPGHIRGSIHISWKDFLKYDATPKPAEQIVAMLAKHGIERGDNFVVY